MRSNLFKRFVSGLIIFFIFWLSILHVPVIFYLLMICLAFGMLIEWINMTKSSKFEVCIGVFLIFFSSISLLNMQKMLPELTFSYFCIIWSIDVCAMLFGKIIKGPKLAKKISPNKTWSGFIGGILGGVFASNVLSKFFPSLPITNHLTWGIILGVIGQLSDLLVSYFKRKYNMKDTGKIIPGHGGLLDRFDSILLTAPLYFHYFYETIVQAHLNM